MENNYLFLIADISGYTSFMKLHAMSVAHAQDIVGALLSELVETARPRLSLCKIEGDAAFLYAPLSRDLSWMTGLIRDMHAAFHALRAEIASTTVCLCGACRQATELRIKFSLHAGPARLQKTMGATDLAGYDVIVAHRLLKVHVPAPEYVLATESVCDRVFGDRGKSLDADLEGIGLLPLEFRELRAAPGPDLSRPARSWLERWRVSLARSWRTLPFILGWKKRCDGAVQYARAFETRPEALAL